MKTKKIKLLILIVLVILFFSFNYNTVNMAATNSLFKTFYDPPTLSMKASKTKFDNVEIILNDENGIKTNTINIYAIDEKR